MVDSHKPMLGMTDIVIADGKNEKVVLNRKFKKKIEKKNYKYQNCTLPVVVEVMQPIPNIDYWHMVATLVV